MAVAHVDQEAAEPRKTSLDALRPWFDYLPPRRRQVAEMTADGMEPIEIARRLGPQHTVYSVRASLHAARVQLAELSTRPPGAPVPPKPCSKCGGFDHDYRRHNWENRQRKQRPAPVAALPEVVDGFESEAPAVDRVRKKLRIIDGRVRSKTVAPSRLSRDEQRAGELADYPTDVDRPAERLDCQQMPRPCPFVSCTHHLYLDVNPASGAIKLNFPHLEVWEMPETCSLDVADRGGITLEEVGAIMNLTRERIRQVEVRGLSKIRDHTGGELGLPSGRGDGFVVVLPKG